MAAISISGGVSLGDTTNGTVYNTASFGISNGFLGLLIVAQSATTAPTTCTVTGAGATTWTEETSLALGYNTLASTTRKIWVFRCQQASFGASAAATLTFGTSGSGAAWSSHQVGNTVIDTAGNGAACIINKKTGGSDAAATSGSLTLDPFSDGHNRPYSAFSHLAAEVATPSTNWTELYDVNYATPNNSLETQWLNSAIQETTASASWTTSVVWGGIAFEIVAADRDAKIPHNIQAGQAVQRAAVM